MNRLITRIALLAACLAASVSLEGEQLPSRVYTIADGLASDRVSCAVQDSRGFIWFCTSEGLSRFDGYQFRTFGIDQGLPGLVSDLLETSTGEYWVAGRNGVYRFNPAASKGSSYFTLYGTGDDSATSLTPDGAGGIWCGTNGGLYRLVRSRGAGHNSGGESWNLLRVEVVVPEELSGRTAVDALLRAGGALWIASESGLHQRFPDGRCERYTARDGLYSDHVTSLLQDRQGTLWVGTWNGLCRILTRHHSTGPSVERLKIEKVGLEGKNVESLLESSGGRLWIGTSEGLYELLAGNGHPGFRSYATAHSPTRQPVHALMEDRLGNVWLAGDDRAVRFAKGGFVTYTEADGLANNRICAIFEDRQGTLCIVTQAPGAADPIRWMNWFDGRRFQAVRPNIPRTVKHGGWGWYQLNFQDHTGEWWIPAGSLYRFSGLSSIAELASAQPKVVPFKGGEEGREEVFRVFEDSRGDIWIGTQCATGDRLLRWERATGILHQCDRLPGSGPTAFAEDLAGDIWVGSIGQGLARYRGGRVQFFGPAEGVPGGWEYGLYVDSRGRLWIATGNGLARTDSPEAAIPTFVTITTADGLSTNRPLCLTEDRWGRIYVGGPRGVDSFYPRKPLRIQHYNAADGLPTTAINQAFRDQRGDLWFGSGAGLVRLKPQPEQRDPDPPIMISALRVRGESRPISALGETQISGLILSPSQNQIEVDFLSPDFRLGAPLRYQYRLENVDAAWSQPSQERTVNFAMLPAGSYRFLVRAVTMDGNVSDKPATLAFAILAPYWAQWWFRTLALMLLAGMIYAAFRFRVGRLLEMERLRTRIATDLHDDIGASLSRIAIMSEVLIRRAGTEKNGLTTQLSDIAGGAREMLASMSDIVWAINPTHDQLRDLVQRMRRFASDVLSARDIEFVFRAPADQELKMDADTRRQLFLVFKEAINNIARHSGCKRTEIELARDRDGLVLSIHDDGKGLATPTPASGGGQGLPSMQARAGMLGGDMAVESQPGQGTSIILRLPTTRVRARRHETIQTDGDKHPDSF